MGVDITPGDLARVYCSHCEQVVYFTFKGGPLHLSCPYCAHTIRIEIVHDGTSWRIKDMQTVRRVRGSR